MYIDLDYIDGGGGGNDGGPLGSYTFFFIFFAFNITFLFLILAVYILTTTASAPFGRCTSTIPQCNHGSENDPLPVRPVLQN